MNNQIKLLRFFVEHKDGKFTINGISKELGVNYRIVFEEIKKLEKESLIKISKIGHSCLCSFNYQFSSKIVEVEDLRKEETFRNKYIKVLFKRITELQNPFYVLLIFGSYARKAQHRHSDLDLCLITDNKGIKAKVNQIVSNIPLNIHLLDFNTKEFLSMLKTTEPNVGKEIVYNNLILRGIEEFYGLVNYAG